MSHQMVVLGAGYAGQIAASLAARRTGTRVTLVNERDRFVERVRLHQLAAGQPLRERPLRELLRGTGVRLIVDQVTGIDTDARTVRLAGGDTVGYGTLVYALGSGPTAAGCPVWASTLTPSPISSRPGDCSGGCGTRAWWPSSAAG